jgi:protein TonB
MLMRSPFMTVPKTSFINVPLLIALFITSIAHLLLILAVKINLPKPEKKQTTLFITLIKPSHQPVPQKSTSAVPVPPITTLNTSTQAAVTKKIAVSNTATPSTALPKPKKPNKFHHVATQPAPLTITSPADTVVAASAPVTEPEVNSTAPVAPIATVPAPIASPKTEAESIAPIPAAVVIEQKTPPLTEPTKTAKAEVDAVMPIIPTPVVAPDAPAVPVVSEPKVEQNSVVTNPTETKQIVLQPESATQEMIDKPVLSSGKPGKKSAEKAAQPDLTRTDNTQPTLSLDDLATQIAQVGEKFGNLPPTAAESRTKKLNAIREHKVSARQYILDWQQKVERIGNRNYPEAARQKDFSARLVMEVGINADGSIHDIKIKKSSGTTALDEAAKNIVQMSAPFAPLPKNLADELAVLIIQRTWQFSDESGMTSW